jgi:hypothetical protein
MKLCLVKQNTTYDLYKIAGPNLRAMVESSNWRSGPIGLWEAFDTEFHVVKEDLAPECQVGKTHWSQYVLGWDIWPEGYEAEIADDIDWSKYDVVITIDVAIPTRIVKKYTEVLWCYYFIEGGPTGIDTIFKGSPFYGYNLFLNHRLGKERLSGHSQQVVSMLRNRRAVLDFPYYLQSCSSIQSLYPEYAGHSRTGITLAHHSYKVLTARQFEALSAFGQIFETYKTISDIHRLELISKYFIMLPEGQRSAGLALIESISAGSLVLAPSHKVWGFPEIVSETLDFKNFESLLRVLELLESNPEVYLREQKRQAEKVQNWCFENPVYNLGMMLEAFRKSKCSPAGQVWSERLSKAASFRTSMYSICRRGVKRCVNAVVPRDKSQRPF